MRTKLILIIGLILLLGLVFYTFKKQDIATPEQTSTSIEDSPLFLKVMEIHDAVMPEMATLHRLKKELGDYDSPENAEIIGTQIKIINDADDAMMSWMSMFKLPDNPNEQQAYLKEEQYKITKVSEQMYQAIESATATLETLKNQ